MNSGDKKFDLIKVEQVQKHNLDIQFTKLKLKTIRNLILCAGFCKYWCTTPLGSSKR